MVGVAVKTTAARNTVGGIILMAHLLASLGILNLAAGLGDRN
jgi:hypothetical protein